MQVDDEKYMATSLNTKTSHPVSSSQTPPSRRGVVIVLCAVVIWSTTPVFIDQLQTAYRLTPLQISIWRALLVTVFLGLYLLVRRPSVFKLQRREIGYYVIYGVVGVSLFNLAFNTSVAINKSTVVTTLSPDSQYLSYARTCNVCSTGSHLLESNDDCTAIDWSGSDCGECNFDADGVTCAESKKVKPGLFYVVFQQLC